MAYLNFIEDEKLEAIVYDLLVEEAKSDKKAEKKFHKNVIDPFTLLFEMATFGISISEWEKNEKMRQAQKTLTNRIGNFHQKILGSVKGFNNLETGKIIDLVNLDLKIIAEVKNKHNTLTATLQATLYDTLEEQVMSKNGKYRG
jgi:hypothetical protein